ncbi:MAG: hypothetical protein OSA47_11745, partial [Novosphingopyxis baekryungensis]|nr:hypothetical protein [Novosphingopyxis baekryungensis]
MALIDLVETKTPEANRAFATKVSQFAEEAGGHRVLANEAIVPMIVPDQRASEPDHATGLLVVSQYPTPQAGRMALAKRKKWAPEFSIDPIRTYTARPATGIESLVERTLPAALGLLGRTPTPILDDANIENAHIEDAQQLESLIDAADVLGDNP